MAKIRIGRDKGWADKIRSYRLIINEQTAGTIWDGEELEINLEKGNYEIYAKIDWCSSNKLKFSVLNSDDKKRFMVKSSLRGLRMFLGIIYISFMPSGYLSIEEI